jgi:hypothetical protein
MLRYAGALRGTVEARPGQRLLRDIRVMRPRQGGLCVPAGALAMGATIPGGTKLADIISPYDFETLETMIAPFAESVVVLARNYATRIQPGDYAFMMGDGASATAY